MFGEQLKLCPECQYPKFVNKFAKDRRQKDGLQKMCRKCDAERMKEYNQENKERLRKQRSQYHLNRYHTNIQFNIAEKTRGRVRAALKSQNVKKENRTIDFLGCKFEFYKNYIEERFTKGMTWDKVMNNEIHLDHIIPVSSFDLENKVQLFKAFYYTNTRPLWAEDNLKKSNKLDYKLPKIYENKIKQKN